MTSSSRFTFIVVMIIAACMVGGGVVLQQTMRIAACPLCILQRMLALLLFFSAALGWFISERRVGRAAVSLVMLACTAAGMLVAGYQTYLQRFARNTQCSGEAAWWELLVDWAGEQVPQLFYASGLCSDPAWKFIGLSLAEWSLALFGGLAVLTLRSLLRRN